MAQIKSNFTLKADDIERVQAGVKSCGETAESVINEYLHGVAGQKMAEQSTRFLPVSKKGKRHAKHNKWYEQENFNLAVGVSNSQKGKRGSSFYYLYFVATGTGTSKRKGANNFLEKGMNKAYDGIVNGLVEALDENIERELK